MEVWDCIIVGAGVVGSWTGYHLAKQKQKVLLLDQFMLPHGRGSSCGSSRLIRMAYTKDFYTAIMPESYRWWQQLEQDSNTKLFEKTGWLFIQHKDEIGTVEETRQSMDAHNLPYDVLPPGDLTWKYHHVLKYNEDFRALIDGNGGILLANKCLQAVQTEFKKAGGVLKDFEKVEKIVPGSLVQVDTSKDSYRAKRVVVAAGPWCTELLATIGITVPVKTMPGMNVYFKVRPKYQHHYSSEKFPIVYTYLYRKPGFYRFVSVFPSLEYPGMVKMITRGEPPEYYCHPDNRDTRGSQDLVNILVQFVKDRLIGVDPVPCILEPCVYSMTPDKDYIIDRHPNHSNIIVAAGFSGTGFMTAPVVGKLLMQLATDCHPTTDLHNVRLPRFNAKSHL